MILAPTLLLNAGSGAAIARPTFSRDFAGEKTLNNGTGPAITFTRASNATFFDASGTLQTASNDTPRFDHSGGSSLGLLIEEARTNLLERSAEFDNAYWSKTSGGTGSAPVVTANVGVAPDGTTTADQIDFDRGAGNTSSDRSDIVRSSITVPATGDYTQSVWLKAATAGDVGKQLAMRNVGGGAYLTVTLTANWVRYARTENTTTTTSRAWSIANRGTFTADNTVSALVWGAQLEAGAFPTSYIPTTSAAATRAADSAVVTPISSFYNQSEGAIVVQSSYAGAGSSAAIPNRVSLQFDDNSVNNRHLLHNRHTNGAGGSSTLVGNVAQAQTTIDTVEVPINTPVFLGMVYKENDIVAAKNGTLSSPDTSASIPTVSRLRIGVAFDGLGPSAFLNGHIRKVAYWPKRLTNTLLEQLTT
jgi:hypothetical protein